MVILAPVIQLCNCLSWIGNIVFLTIDPIRLNSKVFSKNLIVSEITLISTVLTYHREQLYQLLPSQ